MAPLRKSDWNRLSIATQTHERAIQRRLLIAVSTNESPISLGQVPGFRERWSQAAHTSKEALKRLLAVASEDDEENLDPDYPYLVHILNVDEVEAAAEALVKALMDEDDVDDGTVEKMIRMLIEDEVGPIGCKTEKSAKKLAAKLLCGGIHTEIKSLSGDNEDDAIF